MSDSPLVSIGIPTYNRSVTLKRTLESALNQTYKNIEVIISDNASKDDTESLCKQFQYNDNRIRYVKQEMNFGPTNNFIQVLKLSRGEYFMWLGDDDWIDENYIEECLKILLKNKDYSIVCGQSKYIPEKYNDILDRKILTFSHENGRKRLLQYFSEVTDNAIFYGLMRRKLAIISKMKNTIGGDWLFVAGIIFKGKAMTLKNTCLFRRVGGTSNSAKEIAKTLNLSLFSSYFSGLSIAINAFIDIAYKNKIYKNINFLNRILLAIRAFYKIISRSKQFNPKKFLYKFNKLMKINIFFANDTFN